MDDESSGDASWFGEVYRKFEAIRLEDGFKYVEDQLQTIGASVEQFCSEYLPEPVLFNPDSEETPPCDSLKAEEDAGFRAVSSDGVDGGSSEEKSLPQTQVPLNLPSDRNTADLPMHETINDSNQFHDERDAKEYSVANPPLECSASNNGSCEETSADSSAANASVLVSLDDDFEKLDSKEGLGESIVLVEVEELPSVPVDTGTPKSKKKTMVPSFFGLESPKWHSKASAGPQMEAVENRVAVSSSSKDCFHGNEFTATDWEIV